MARGTLRAGVESWFTRLVAGASKAGQQFKAKYDAGGTGRRMAGWVTPPSGPNRAITEQPKIRDRARDTSRNDWSGASTTQHWSTNLIGIGIVPRFKRIKSKDRKKALIDAWDDFVDKADADGVLNLYGLQTLAVRSWFESGEVFIRKRPQPLAAPLPVPLQIQVIESDFVPQLDADQWPGMPAGNIIRQGIERNRFGRRIAYWMYREHPGDNAGGRINAQDLVRVDARDVCHIYEPKRPGQLRGVSEMAPIITRLRNIGDFDDAVLERQKLSNLFMAFIKRQLPTAYDEDYDPLTNLPIQRDENDAPLAPMMPGTTQELLPGEEVQFANPPEAGTTYSDYMRTQHMATSAGTGLPYELMAGDIRQISDRTLRLVINEFRRFCEQRQWQVVIPMMCRPVLAWWATAMYLTAQCSAEELVDITRAEWSPHGWPYMHPVQDAQAKQIEVEAGFRSRSSVIAERGDDPEQVDDERQADDEREDALGLKPEPPAAAPGAPGQKPGNDPAAKPDAATTAQPKDDGVERFMAALAPFLAAQQQLTNAMMDRQQAANAALAQELAAIAKHLAGRDALLP